MFQHPGLTGDPEKQVLLSSNSSASLKLHKQTVNSRKQEIYNQMGARVQYFYCSNFSKDNFRLQ